MQVKRRRRLVAWLAAFAVLLQALWPLLSHARPRDPSLLVPVCTIDGVTHFLEIKTGKSPLEERSASHGEHCKLCVFGDGKSLRSEVGESVFAQIGTSDKAERLRSLFQKQSHSLSARTRAPPAAS